MVWIISVLLVVLFALSLAYEPVKLSGMRDSVKVDFEANQGFVFSGGCVVLTWHVVPTVNVLLDNIKQNADGNLQICPEFTEDHALSIAPPGVKPFEFVLTTEVLFSSTKSRSVAALLFCLA